MCPPGSGQAKTTSSAKRHFLNLTAAEKGSRDGPNVQLSLRRLFPFKHTQSFILSLFFFPNTEWKCFERESKCVVGQSWKAALSQEEERKKIKPKTKQTTKHYPSTSGFKSALLQHTSFMYLFFAPETLKYPKDYIYILNRLLQSVKLLSLSSPPPPPPPLPPHIVLFSSLSLVLKIFFLKTICLKSGEQVHTARIEPAFVSEVNSKLMLFSGSNVAQIRVPVFPITMDMSDYVYMHIKFPLRSIFRIRCLLNTRTGLGIFLYTCLVL